MGSLLSLAISVPWPQCQPISSWWINTPPIDVSHRHATLKNRRVKCFYYFLLKKKKKVIIVLQRLIPKTAPELTALGGLEHNQPPALTSDPTQ